MGRILVKITRYNEWLIDFVFLYKYKVLSHNWPYQLANK